MSRLAALVLLLVATHVQAERYCVATAAQFQNALAQAAASPEDSVIDVATGAYDFAAPAGGAAIAYSSNSSLSINGGWNGSCTAIASRDPEQTLLRVSNTGRLMHLLFQSQSTNDISLTRLGFRQGSSTTLDLAGCVTAEGDVGASGRLTLLNTSFRLCNSTVTGGALNVVGRGLDLDLRNSVFADNGSTFATITLTMIGSSTFHVTNNTIAFNPSTGGVVGLQLSSIGNEHFLWLINNAIYNNGPGTANELTLDDDMIGVVNYNIVGRMNPVPAGMASSNNSNANPMFVSSTNLRPVDNSPLRNAGSNSAPIGLPAFDNAGETRPQGGRYDIGAYEFPELFKSGFE